MPVSLRGLALTVALLGVPLSGLAQIQIPEDVGLRSEILGLDLLVVAQVKPDGTIQLAPSPSMEPSLRSDVSQSNVEGYYVLMTKSAQPGGKTRLFRAQVTDVAEGLVFTVKIGAGATEHVHVKDTAELLRPVIATTARLKALPDEIPLPSEKLYPNSAVMAREAPMRVQSIKNLTKIGFALSLYQETYNQYPPAVIYGPDGKPWHSWRVLILPQLTQSHLYQAYDFNQPWDSPKNKTLLDKMPEVYRDPIHGDAKGHDTHYAALVGPQAVFRPTGAKQTAQVPVGKGGTEMREVLDGTSNTVMVTTVDPARKIPWTKPEDIDVGPDFAGFGKPGGIAASYTAREGGKCAPFLFADGRVTVINTSIKPGILEALFTRAGHDDFPPNTLPGDSGKLGRQKVLKIYGQGANAAAIIE